MKLLTLLLLTLGLAGADQKTTSPQIISKVNPFYTQEATDAKVTGTIVLTLTVDTEGKPANVQVVRGLGYGLDEEAVTALKQWKFKPGTKGGKPVPVETTVQINFRLEDIQ